MSNNINENNGKHGINLHIFYNPLDYCLCYYYYYYYHQSTITCTIYSTDARNILKKNEMMYCWVVCVCGKWQRWWWYGRFECQWKRMNLLFYGNTNQIMMSFNKYIIFAKNSGSNFKFLVNGFILVLPSTLCDIWYKPQKYTVTTYFAVTQRFDWVST